LPQGQPEKNLHVVRSMIALMEKEGFGYFSNHYECEAVLSKAKYLLIYCQIYSGLLAAALKEGA
jgi:hypothetical protein